MDGNKKITGIILSGIIALAITACKVQAPGYASLYVDNLISVNDTAAYPGKTSLSMADTNAVTKDEPTGDLRPAKEIVKVSYDSVYQHEIKKWLKAITDSIQLLQSKNDTITMLRNQVYELKKYADLKADTVYVIKEIVTQFKGDSIQTDNEFTRLLHSKNDTILSLRRRVNELQSSGIIKADTVYVIKEMAVSQVAENQQTDHLTLQLIKAKDEQIQILQNQLNEMQAAAARTPQPTPVIREPAQVQPPANQQPDQSTLQLTQAQYDTIQFLKNQLRNLQLQPYKRDTVYIEKETKELQPANEPAAQQTVTDFQSLQDTIRLLNTRVLSLEKHNLPGKDTTATASQDEKDVPLTVITDTILFVAYYEMGKIKPLEEEGILQQIKELCRDKSVKKITLSGYTDSSGNEIINLEITNRRLNYLLERISPWVAKDKVYFQNFRDAFASKKIVNEERKVEIRILTE